MYCSAGDFYIDPKRKVKKAIITHGHSDHAYAGMNAYLCTPITKYILKLRLGSHIQVQSLDYEEEIVINGVKLSFFPAGHIPGSAQVRMEYQGRVTVVSGDYKLENDGLAAQFQSVRCHEFVTESTFGLPIYQWEKQETIYDEIALWWSKNRDQNKLSIIYAYPLGKAQRIIHAMSKYYSEIIVHGSVANTNEALKSAGVQLPTIKKMDDYPVKSYPGYLLITPPSYGENNWLNKKNEVEIAEASGWMMSKSRRKNMLGHEGFVLSDHADWSALNAAIRESGAEKIYVMHGFTESFAKWLQHIGYDAVAVHSKVYNSGDPEINS